MNRMCIHPAAAGLLCLFAAAPLRAQSPVCRDDETVRGTTGCLERRVGEFQNVLKGTAEADAGRGEREDLEAETAGPNVASRVGNSAIRDFLPLFAGALIVPGVSDDAEALDLRVNLRLPGPFKIQGGVTIHPAELFAPLLDSIPESIRQDARERLGNELEDGDDVTVFGALNVENRSLGRSFTPHRAVADMLAAAIVASADAGLGHQSELALRYDAVAGSITAESLDPARRARPECARAVIGSVVHLGSLRFDCLRTGVRAALESEVLSAARFEAERQAAITDSLESFGFNHLSELINNQPQLNVTVEHRNRNDLVGPNEITAKARFEAGFVNMNGLRASCGVAGVTPACLRSYLTGARRRRLDRSDRVWAAADWIRRWEYDVELESDAARIELGSASSVTLSGGYGRYFGAAEGEKDDRDRIDLEVRYNSVRDDALRQTRFLASLFYTARLSDQSSAVFGLTWANRPEFLGEDGRRLGANLGLTYKLSQP